MKYILCSYILIALVFSSLFLSCKKAEVKTSIEPFDQAFKAVSAASGGSSNSFYPGTYIGIKSNFTFPSLSQDDGAYVAVLGRYTDSATGNIVSMGDISVGGNVISPTTSQTYNSRLDSRSGLSLVGTNTNIEIGPTSAFPYQLRTIYIPKAIYVTSLSYQGSHIQTSISHTLTWNPDPSNMFNKVQIQVNYNQGLSQALNPAFPNSISNLIYKVSDNGSFVIPSSDLQRFPLGSIVNIYIGRASLYVDNLQRADGSRTSITYIAITEAASIPLSVVN